MHHGSIQLFIEQVKLNGVNQTKSKGGLSLKHLLYTVICFLLIEEIRSECSSNCYECLPNASVCSYCMQGFLLVNSQCVVSTHPCEYGLFFDPHVDQCVAICSGNQLTNSDTRSCIPVPTCSTTLEFGNNLHFSTTLSPPTPPPIPPPFSPDANPLNQPLPHHLPPQPLSNIVYLSDWNYFLGINIAPQQSSESFTQQTSSTTNINTEKITSENELMVYCAIKGTLVYSAKIEPINEALIHVSTYEVPTSTDENQQIHNPPSIKAQHKNSYVILRSDDNTITIIQIHMFTQIASMKLEKKWSIPRHAYSQLIDSIPNPSEFSLLLAATNLFDNQVSIFQITQDTYSSPLHGIAIANSQDHIDYRFHLLGRNLLLFKPLTIQLINSASSEIISTNAFTCPFINALNPYKSIDATWMPDSKRSEIIESSKHFIVFAYNSLANVLVYASTDSKCCGLIQLDSMYLSVHVSVNTQAELIKSESFNVLVVTLKSITLYVVSPSSGYCSSQQVSLETNISDTLNISAHISASQTTGIIILSLLKRKSISDEILSDSSVISNEIVVFAFQQDIYATEGTELSSTTSLIKMDSKQIEFDSTFPFDERFLFSIQHFFREPTIQVDKSSTFDDLGLFEPMNIDLNDMSNSSNNNNNNNNSDRRIILFLSSPLTLQIFNIELLEEYITESQIQRMSSVTNYQQNSFQAILKGDSNIPEATSDTASFLPILNVTLSAKGMHFVMTSATSIADSIIYGFTTGISIGHTAKSLAGRIARWDLLSKEMAVSERAAIKSRFINASIVGASRQILLVVEDITVRALHSESLVELNSLELNYTAISQVSFSSSHAAAILLLSVLPINPAPPTTDQTLKLQLVEVSEPDCKAITMNNELIVPISTFYLSKMHGDFFFTCSNSNISRYRIFSIANNTSPNHLEFILEEERIKNSSDYIKCEYDVIANVLLVWDISSLTRIENPIENLNDALIISVPLPIEYSQISFTCNQDTYFLSTTSLLCLTSSGIDVSPDYLSILDFSLIRSKKLLFLEQGVFQEIMTVNSNEFDHSPTFIAVYIKIRATDDPNCSFYANGSCLIQKYIVDITCLTSTDDSTCYSIEGQQFLPTNMELNCNTMLFSATTRQFYAFEASTSTLIESSKVPLQFNECLDIEYGGIKNFFLIPQSGLISVFTSEYLLFYSNFEFNERFKIPLAVGELVYNVVSIDTKQSLVVLTNQRIFRLNEIAGLSVVNAAQFKELLVLSEYPDFVIAFGGGRLIKFNVDNNDIEIEEVQTSSFGSAPLSNLTCVMMHGPYLDRIGCAGIAGNQTISIFVKEISQMDEWMRVDLISYKSFSFFGYDQHDEYLYLVTGAIFTVYESWSGLVTYTKTFARQIINVYLTDFSIFVITLSQTCIFMRNDLISPPSCNGFVGNYLGSLRILNSNLICIYTSNTQQGSYSTIDITTGNRLQMKMTESSLAVSGITQDEKARRLFVAYQNGFLYSLELMDITGEKLFFHPAFMEQSKGYQAILKFEHLQNRIVCLYGSRILFFQVDASVPKFYPFAQSTPIQATSTTISTSYILDASNRIYMININRTFRMFVQTIDRVYEIIHLGQPTDVLVVFTANAILFYQEPLTVGSILPNDVLIKQIKNIAFRYAFLALESQVLLVVTHNLDLFQINTITLEHTSNPLNSFFVNDDTRTIHYIHSISQISNALLITATLFDSQLQVTQTELLMLAIINNNNITQLQFTQSFKCVLPENIPLLALKEYSISESGSSGSSNIEEDILIYLVFADGTLRTISSKDQTLLASSDILDQIKLSFADQTRSLIESAIFANDSKKLVISLIASRRAYMIDLVSNWVSLILTSSLERKTMVFNDNSLMISSRNTFQFFISMKRSEPFFFIYQSDVIQSNQFAQTIVLDSNLFLRITANSTACLFQSLNLEATQPSIRSINCFTLPYDTTNSLAQHPMSLRYLNRFFTIEQTIFLKLKLLFDRNSGSIYLKEIFLVALPFPSELTIVDSAYESFGYIDYSHKSEQQKCQHVLENGDIYQYLRLSEHLSNNNDSSFEVPELSILVTEEVIFHPSLATINTNSLSIKGNGWNKYLSANADINKLTAYVLNFDNFMYNLVSNIGKIINSSFSKQVLIQSAKFISTDRIPARLLARFPPEYMHLNASMNFSTNTVLVYEHAEVVRLMNYTVQSIFFHNNEDLIIMRNVSAATILNFRIDSCAFSNSFSALLFEAISYLRIDNLYITNNIVFGGRQSEFAFLRLKSISYAYLTNIFIENNTFIPSAFSNKLNDVIVTSSTISLIPPASIFRMIGVDQANFRQGKFKNCKGFTLLSSLKESENEDMKINNLNNSFELNSIVFEDNDNMLVPPTSLVNIKPSLVVLSNALLHLEEITFTNNNCYFCLGSLNIAQSSQIYIVDSNFTQNLAYSGGAIYISSAQYAVILDGTIFMNNTALFSGGSIFLSDSSISVSNSCRFLNNSALIGGAIRSIGSSQIVQIGSDDLKEIFKENHGYIYGDSIGYLPSRLTISLTDSNTKSPIDPSEYASLRSGIIVDISIQIYDQFDQLVRIISNSEFDGLNPFQKQIIVKEFELYQIEIALETDSTQSSSVTNSSNNNVTTIDGSLSQSQTTRTSFSISGTKIIDAFNSFDVELNGYVFKKILLAGEFGIAGVLGVQTKLLENGSANVVTDLPQLFSSAIQAHLYFEHSIVFRDCVKGEITSVLLQDIRHCEPCAEGTYSLGRSETEKEKCFNCPEGSSHCHKDTITIEDGFWRANTSTDEILQCSKNSDMCKGDANSDQKHYCLEGYTGPLCESCDTTGEIWGGVRYNQNMEKRCSRCMNDEVLLPIAGMMFFGFNMYIMLTSAMFLRNFQKNSSCFYMRLMRILPMSASQYRDLNASLTKQLVNYLQLSVIFTFAKIGVPDISSYLNVSVGNPTLAVNYSLSCVVYGGTLDVSIMLLRALAILITPIALIFAQWVVLTILTALKKIDKRTASHLFFIVTSFVPAFYLSGATSSLAEMLGCRQIGSEKYLLYDPKLLCEDNESNWKVVAWLILVLWTCFPLIVGAQMWRIRGKLHTAVCKYRLGYFYLEYNSRFYYWETVRYLFKITIVVSFKLLQTKSEQRRVVSITLLMVYLFLVRKFPIFRSRVVQCNEVRQFQILIAIVSSEFLTLSNTEDHLRSVISALMQLLHYGFITFTGFYVLKQYLHSIDIHMYPRLHNLLKASLSESQLEYCLAHVFLKSNLRTLLRWKFVHRSISKIISMNTQEILKSDYVQKQQLISCVEDPIELFMKKHLQFTNKSSKQLSKVINKNNNNNQNQQQQPSSNINPSTTDNQQINIPNEDQISACTSSNNLKNNHGVNLISSSFSMQLPFKNKLSLSSVSLQKSFNFDQLGLRTKQNSILDFNQSEISLPSSPQVVHGRSLQRNAKESVQNAKPLQKVLKPAAATPFKLMMAQFRENRSIPIRNNASESGTQGEIEILSSNDEFHQEAKLDSFFIQHALQESRKESQNASIVTSPMDSPSMLLNQPNTQSDSKRTQTSPPKSMQSPTSHMSKQHITQSIRDYIVPEKTFPFEENAASEYSVDQNPSIGGDDNHTGSECLEIEEAASEAATGQQEKQAINNVMRSPDLKSTFNFVNKSKSSSALSKKQSNNNNPPK